MASKRKRTAGRGGHWLLPVICVLLLIAGGCFVLLYTAGHFSLSGVPGRERDYAHSPLIDREALRPTEPPTEPPTQPPTEEPYEMSIDMARVASHHSANPDVIGWVRIKDTVINYPIMQDADNTFYIDHNWQGAPSFSGSIFADYRCSIDTSDNTLVYGHNMGNGTMLHAIKNYKVEDWGRSHPYIEVASLEHRYLYRVLSCNVIYGEQGAKFEYWNGIDMNRTAYRLYYESIERTASVWYGDVIARPRDNIDRLLTLQTCNSGADNGIRCVVFAQCIGER